MPGLLEVAQSSLIELGFGVLRVIDIQGLLRPTLKRVDIEHLLYHVTTNSLIEMKPVFIATR